MKLPFELLLVKNYLLPKRNSLSTALISIVSTIVLALIICLSLIFFSITRSIEKNWIHKLTSVHAPLRVFPTQTYFSSYYYQSDQLSSNSGFAYKSLGEKWQSVHTDPYQEDLDPSLSLSMQKQKNQEHGKDYTKTLIQLLQKEGIAFQEYETTAALMQAEAFDSSGKRASLSQMNYLMNFLPQSPSFSYLLLPPSSQEILTLLQRSPQDPRIVENIFWKKVSLSYIPVQWIQEGQSFPATLLAHTIRPQALLTKKGKGVLKKEKGKLFFEEHGKKILLEQKKLPLEVPLTFSPSQTTKKKVEVEVSCLGHMIKGEIAFDALSLMEVAPKTKFQQKPKHAPLWPYFFANSWHFPKKVEGHGILLPKHYQKQGVFLGAKGNLQYQAQSFMQTKQLKIPFYVAGFYDPGILPVGSRFLFASQDLVKQISASHSAVSLDQTPTNGIFIWPSKLEETLKLKLALQKQFQKEGIDHFFHIQSYQEFPFAQDLFGQFHNDRLLFSFIALLVLAVACSNIISMLILLVHQKKKEIAILRSLGARSLSIFTIFCLCGLCMGVLAFFFGSTLAFLFLSYLQNILGFLAYLQGTPFHPLIQGIETFSMHQATWFWMALTIPILSVLAACIPAYKALKIQPSQVFKETL